MNFSYYLHFHYTLCSTNIELFHRCAGAGIVFAVLCMSMHWSLQTKSLEPNTELFIDPSV